MSPGGHGQSPRRSTSGCTEFAPRRRLPLARPEQVSPPRWTAGDQMFVAGQDRAAAGAGAAARLVAHCVAHARARTEACSARGLLTEGPKDSDTGTTRVVQWPSTTTRRDQICGRGPRRPPFLRPPDPTVARPVLPAIRVLLIAFAVLSPRLEPARCSSSPEQPRRWRRRSTPWLDPHPRSSVQDTQQAWCSSC